MSFTSKKASRGNVKPFIGIYSESGCGKSMGALLVARGLVGPNGNIQQIDSEAGRGELYSDVIPGGYNTIQLAEPFSPARYIEAVRYAESLKADVIVIDQISSAWEGIGGVLDMAAANEAEGKKGLSVWKTPKVEHGKMVVRLQQSTCPIIVCLRAKFKSRQVKQNGRTEIVKDEFATPIQSEDFIFELTVHGQVTQDHHFHPTKISHPTLGACFPTDGPIEIKHGEALAKWCASPGVKPSVNSSGTLLAKLRELTVGIHGFKAGMPPVDWAVRKPRLTQWLYDENLLAPDKSLDNLTNEELVKLIEKVQTKLDVPMP